MMRGADRGFAYAQPRLQVRLVERPDSVAWQRLHATRDLAALLQTCAATTLVGWTARLRADATVHELEARLREEWRDWVARLANWLPRHWRASFTWLGWLPWLGLLDALARGEAAPGWLCEDPVVGALATAPAAARATELEALGLTALAPAFAKQTSVPLVYAAQWRRSWPTRDPAARRTLDGLLRLVARHRALLAAQLPAAGSDPVLQSLERGLLRSFRRNALRPAAAAAVLGLVAMDFAHLRGLVIERASRRPGGP